MTPYLRVLKAIGALVRSVMATNVLDNGMTKARLKRDLYAAVDDALRAIDMFEDGTRQ